MQTNSNNWSRGRLEYVTNCPACGSAHRSELDLTRRDNEAVMPDLWRMVQCADCKSIWLDPRPDTQSLPRAYDDYYTHNVEDESFPQGGATGLAWRLVHGYLNRRFNMNRQPAISLGYALFTLIEPWRLKLDYYGRHLTKSRVGIPGRLLDIGCGNGAFLNRAREMGWQVQGCEVDPKAVASCCSLDIDVIEGDAFAEQFVENTFDVITMCHVIEHVHDQPALLQRSFDLLRPGGFLWLACPNPQSLGLKTFGSAWSELHPPCHLSIPSQNILIDWLQKEGFSDIVGLRRGAHSRRFWNECTNIANRESISLPSPISFFSKRILANIIATFSSKYAEETVLIARKPR